jgi:hypothetical protein
MSLCKIEIDYGRQSFRVYRDGVTQEPQKKPAKLDLLQPFQTDVCKESYERAEMSTGGLLTAIHIPAVPDNNFEKIFNSMLPEDISVQRSRNCSCHTRQHKDVDMNKIMFDLVNSICKTKQAEKDGQESGTESETRGANETGVKQRTTLNLQRNLTHNIDFWIGAEYKYDVKTNELMLKFVLIGQSPENGKKMFIKVNVLGRKTGDQTQLKLERLGQKNKIGEEITIEMASYSRTLETRVGVTLHLKRGFLRKARCIHEWQFPLDDCHCIYPRSFWKNVIC